MSIDDTPDRFLQGDQVSAGSLAIVIVTRNRRASLSRTLHRLRNLEADFPIVVVDNASDDGTRTMLRRQFPYVRLLALGQNVGAVARDLGVRIVQAPYVAFADDDSWYAPGSLSRAVAFFDHHPRLGLLMSRILVGPQQRLDPICQLMSRTPLPAHPHTPGFPILGFVACGALVRRAAYLAAGGFNPRFGTGGEEDLLAITLAQNGWALSYVPQVVSHHHPSTKRDLGSRYVTGERNRFWTIWLRRRTRAAARLTLCLLRQAITVAKTRQGFLRALAGLPFILHQRHPVAPHLEAQLALLDEQRQGEANC